MPDRQAAKIVGEAVVQIAMARPRAAGLNDIAQCRVLGAISSRSNHDVEITNWRSLATRDLSG